MNCLETSHLLGASVDDELDARSVAEVESHLARCPACAEQKSELLALRATIRERLPRFDPPPGLEDRLFASATKVQRRRRLPWREAGLMTAAACATLVATFALRPLRDGTDAEIVDAHVRSLQVGHLTDVASTDQHTVKPWFQGKLDFGVPTRDFAAQGFALVGGRLDVVSGHPAAALVYRRRQHLLNLFVVPATGSERRRDVSARGYRVSTWTHDGLRYQLVSDIAPSESDELVALLRAE